MKAPDWLSPWAIVLFGLVVCACADHEPELERRGGLLPDPDALTAPMPCLDGAGGEGGAPVAVSYCQAELVLDAVCRRCHTSPPLNGAPFSLATYEDTQLPFGTSGKLRWQRMQEVVESGFMPPRGFTLEPPLEPLTCEQKATLLGWLAQCASPEGGTDCEGRSETLLRCE